MPRAPPAHLNNSVGALIDWRVSGLRTREGLVLIVNHDVDNVEIVIDYLMKPRRRYTMPGRLVSDSAHCDVEPRTGCNADDQSHCEYNSYYIKNIHFMPLSGEINTSKL